MMIAKTCLLLLATTTAIAAATPLKDAANITDYQ